MSLCPPDYALSHLSPAVARLGRAFTRPKTIAVLCVIALTGLGWIYLGLMASRSGQLGAVIDLLCRPATTTATAGGLALIWSMWCAMALAMMLPTAGPMILTYAEIAETAARKGQTIVSPFVLTAGYAAIWFGFAVVATALQAMLARAALLDSGLQAASPLFSGAIFIAAGLYQFSALKHACVTKCQQPFPFFFTRWTDKRMGVFRLGLEQGAYCLGCCWAMMLVMFAAGVMNVIWMAVLGAVMAIEKIGVTTRFGHAVGGVLVAIGVVFVVDGMVNL